MRLCVVTSSFPANRADGRATAGLFVRDFCVALAAQGHKVTVVTPDFVGLKKEEVPGIAVRWYPRWGGQQGVGYLRPWRPLDVLAMISIFRRGRRMMEHLAATEHFDHVMAMWAVPSGWLAAGLKRRFQIPFSVWCLGSDVWVYGRYPIMKGAVRKVIKAADQVYADGIALAEEVKRLSRRDCLFMPTSRLLDKSLVRPVYLEGHRPQFLFVGRYAPVKGVDILLDAMAKYRATGHAGHLTMFGGGPLEESVRERAARPDLADCVTVNGYAEEATYVSHLVACDCSIIPSRMESIPVVLSDAIHMGTPVIVSDVGDMGLLLRQVPAGLVVPPEDVDALCGAMVRFAEVGASPFAEHITALSARFDIARVAEEWVGRIQK